MQTLSRHRHLWVAAVLLAAVASASAETIKITNHTNSAYENELVRLKANLATVDAAKILVLENGKPVPHQLEMPTSEMKSAQLWVLVNLASKESKTFEVKTDAAPAKADKRVKVMKDGDNIILDNGDIGVRIPTKAALAPAPINGVRIKGGPWLGEGRWQTSLPGTAKVDITGDGTLFGQVTLNYDWSPPTRDQAEAKSSRINIRVMPDRPVVEITESHSMGAGNSWSFNLTANNAMPTGFVRGWQSGPFQGNENLREVKLLPNDRLGNVIAKMQPRWTQGFDQAWQFNVANDDRMLGAIVARAGRWVWPFDNLIDVAVDSTGKTATLVMPTVKGGRFWYLVGGERALADKGKELVTQLAFRPLDKLHNEYDLEWPGQPAGGFEGFDYFSSGINPTGSIRGMGRGAVANAGKPGNRSTLSSVQAMLDPDCYGYYYNHWGPINPNFATDLLRVPIARTTQLKAHPNFEKFRKMAEDAFRMDVEHTITMPGGAGQESPGYTTHAMGAWASLAPICREHLGFDPMKWPRVQEGARFIVKTSQPLGDGQRRILPLGDTHPPGTDVFKFAEQFGVKEDPTKWVSEEFPGFGVVLRSRSGKNDENFFAFKAGPNRGHNHGDQLSFHYAGDGRRLAIDHMCSYAPRADQEHMHNRVAFSTADWPYANIDGHERLIAFKTSPTVDVAIGQVESPRIRVQPKTPQETKWDEKGPYVWFKNPINYRRTVVFIKDPAGKAHDFFVIRDQWSGGDDKLKATYCLHVDSNVLNQNASTVDFKTMQLLVAHPQKASFERFDWSYTKGKTGGKEGFGESTVGARFTAPADAREFVTVLYPSGKAPEWQAIDNGVKVGLHTVTFDADGGVKVAGGATFELAAKDIDLNRNQGDIGLFVPECGYDFGPIPQWLIDQRAKNNPRATR